MALFGLPNIAKLEEKGNVKGLIKALAHNQASIRVAAAQALGRLGQSEAVGPLISAMLDDDNAVAVVAATSLGQIGDPAAVEALVVMLHGATLERRTAALRALGQIGTEPALDGIAAVLHLENDALDEQAALALAEAGPAHLPRLLGMLAADQPRIRNAALAALRAMGVAAIQPLGEYTHSKDTAQAEQAVDALGQIQSATALQALIPLLDTGSYSLRSRAQEALAAAGAAAVPPLVAALAGANQNAQRAIIQALGATGQPAAATTLAEIVTNGAKPLARAAVQALGQLGAAAAAPILLAALANNDWLLRQHAIEGLARLQPDDEIRAGLANALFDAIGTVRKAALKAIEELNWEPATADERAAYHVARQDWAALAKLGGEALPALSRLIPLLLAEERKAVVQVLAQAGPQALEPLLALLDHSDIGTRAAAAQGLGALGDLRAVPGLLAELAHNSSNSGAAAATALGLLGAEEAVAALENAVRNGSATVRAAAAPALAQLGAAGAAALLALAQSDNAYVARAAISGLAAVQAPDAVACILRLTLDERQEVQQDAIKAAAALGKVIVPAATALLRTGDSRTRVIMADLLGHVGDRTAEAALLRAYWHQDPDTSQAAARSLALLGAPPPDARFDPARVQTLFTLVFTTSALRADERHWLESEALRDLAEANSALDTLHARLAADQTRLVGDVTIVGPFGHHPVSMIALFKAWLQAQHATIPAWDGWFYHREITIEGEQAINTAVLLYYQPHA